MTGTPFHVALVVRRYPGLGGVERQVHQLAPRLECQGLTVTIVAESRAGVDDEVLRVLPAGTTPIGAREALRVRNALRREPADLFHFRDLSRFLAPAVALAPHRPVLVTLTRTGSRGDVSEARRSPMGRALFQLAKRRVHFVALSDELVTEVTALGVAPARVHLVPNGVDEKHHRPADPDERAALRTRLGLPRDGPIVIYTGRLAPEKNVDVLLTAARDLSDLTVLVVGEGPEWRALGELVVELGIQERVWFTGAVEDVATYLRASDIFALPSSAEGMSNALLEAMACGLRCISAPVSGSTRLLGEDRGLIAASEVGAWRTALVAAMSSESESWGPRARAYIEAEHTFDVAALALTRVYDAVLGRAPSSPG